MQRGLWITVERDPAKAGGLGEVSKTVPMELNQKLGLDVRVIVPALKPLLDEGDWTETGETVSVFLPWVSMTTPEPFQLLQKYENTTSTWVYAIHHERFFAPFKHLYFPGHEAEYRDQDPSFKAIMLFNRLAVLFIPKLGPEAVITTTNPTTGEKTTRKQAAKSKLERFDQEPEFVMVHDWLTAPVLHLLPDTVPYGKIFMLHNAYDQPRPPEYVQQVLNLPYGLARNMKGLYSPLESGIAHADVIVANQNYVRSLTQKDVWDNLVINLRRKMTEGRVFDVHHGISDRYSPETSPVLKTEGFTPLKPVPATTQKIPSTIRRGVWHNLLSAVGLYKQDRHGHQHHTLTAQISGVAARKELARYKQINKKALQQLLGLHENPSAVIITWIGRFDPFQKGFYLFMNEVRELLHRTDDVQIIIGGSNSSGDARIASFLDNLKDQHHWRESVYINDEFISWENVVRIYAGSDFLIMPSLYEPYGLTQLEAMKLGTIPIVHGVDGLRSTVFDPDIDALDSDTQIAERVWDYGQVGVKIELMNALVYQQATLKVSAGERLNQNERWVLEDSQRKFRLALTRAIRLAHDTERYLTVVENGMRYVNTEHAWDKIIARYQGPIQRAILEAQIRQIGSR